MTTLENSQNDYEQPPLGGSFMPEGALPDPILSPADLEAARIDSLAAQEALQSIDMQVHQARISRLIGRSCTLSSYEKTEAGRVEGLLDRANKYQDLLSLARRQSEIGVGGTAIGRVF